MNPLVYPLNFHRQFERRLAASMADDQKRQSQSQGTDSCNACGYVVTAPSGSTHLPTGRIVNHWHCSACGNSWETFVDPLLETKALATAI